MDLDLLRTFVELQEAGTMSTAATRLFVTQATVSSRIAQLEEHLGKRLFVRSNAGTQLTVEGRKFTPYARQMLSAWLEAKREVGAIGNQQASVTIGGEYSLATSLLLNWLVALRKDRPHVHLHAVV